MGGAAIRRRAYGADMHRLRPCHWQARLLTSHQEGRADRVVLALSHAAHPQRPAQDRPAGTLSYRRRADAGIGINDTIGPHPPGDVPWRSECAKSDPFDQYPKHLGNWFSRRSSCRWAMVLADYRLPWPNAACSTPGMRRPPPSSTAPSLPPIGRATRATTPLALRARHGFCRPGGACPSARLR
jgi:hypothetical protein